MKLSNDHAVELLQKVAQRDKNAMHMLYRGYSRQVYAYALKVLNDAALAEEAVVDTMVEVWKNADQFRGDAKCSTWMIGIAHTMALRSLRKKGRIKEFFISQTNAVKDEDSEGALLERAREALPRNTRAAAATAVTVPADIGWHAFLKRTGQQPVRFSSAWQAHLKYMLAQWTATSTFRYVMLVIVAAQAGLIGFLLVERHSRQKEFAPDKSLAAVQAATGPVLRIRFKSATVERDMRALLLSIDGVLVSGPSQRGDYIVNVPEGHVIPVAAALQNNAAVDRVHILPGIPALK